MSTIRVAAAGPLRGEGTVPGDKSIGHRAVFFAALASGRSRITGLSGGEDNRRTVRAFMALGVPIHDEGNAGLVIDGRGLDGLVEPAAPIDCGNSGTAMRLLCGVLAPRPFGATLIGDQYLEARPMARVVRPLRQMGAHIEGRPGGKPGEILPPIVVGPAAGPLRGIEYRAPIASAQVKSAVLLAALCARGATRIEEPMRTRDHTERMLAAMGAPVRVDGNTVMVDPEGWDRRLRPRDMIVPGDLSSAAFLLGAALVVPGSLVTIRGVGVNLARSGVIDALWNMGAQLSITNFRDAGGEPVADITARSGPLSATRIDGAMAVRAIDELPLLAAVAAHAQGETLIADASELRVKESDRIAAMAEALAAMGVAVMERPDGWVIRGGGGVRGGRVASHGDHRIAMAAAVCTLGGRGETIIDDADNVATSFPTFVSTLASLGADIAQDHGYADRRA